ncbi:MAG: ABC transporter permease [Akkermansiaceae bacterium]|nr:ABC transporter permease [Akkermansiaceae bacterium]
MTYVAFRMLIGDRAKYIGLLFAVAFSTFLLQNQSSIFSNLMKRAGNQVRDVTDADVWVMAPRTDYFDQTKPLKETDLLKVRGVRGVDYAVRIFKSLPIANTRDGQFSACTVLGLDDATLVGAPRNMILGDWQDLWKPESVVIDKAGYLLLFPGEELRLGRELELNDKRVRIVGISDALPAFTTFPIIHARYSEALTFQGRQRQQLSFVLARPQSGVDAEELAVRIAEETGLKALTSPQFQWASVSYYLRNTGIPVNFGITVVVSIIVGLVVTGQTFYLFILENLKQFGALKAIGVTNRTMLAMVLFQSLLVWFVGVGFGTALSATFFNVSPFVIQLRHFILFWESAVGVAAFMLLVIIIASSAGLLRVIRLQPAEVFR